MKKSTIFATKLLTMKNIFRLFLVAVLALTATASFGQCTFIVTDSQPFVESFDDGLECWTVDANGGNWSAMTGSSTTLAAFSGSNNGDEARLISPVLDLSQVGSANFSFSYAMMGLYENDELVVSYRTSETDTWHTLGTYSISDYQNFYEDSFELTDLSATYQISFLGRFLGGYMIFVDNVEVLGSGGCVRPTSLSATEITAFSALLGWSTTGTEESWTVEINGNIKTVDVQPFLMEGLEPQMDYSFTVKANCGDGMESEWATPVTFTTRCDVIPVTDDEPFFDDFEASEDFVCWYNEISSGIDGWVVDPGYTILNNTAFFIWLGGEAVLISPQLDITAVTNPTLTFKHKQLMSLSYGTVDELYVAYRTDVNDTWHVLHNFSEATTDWETVTIALPSPSATYQIGFDGVGHDAEGVYVDDVRVGNSNDGVNEAYALNAYVNPNPTTGKITVNANVSNGKAIVFDVFGRQITDAAIIDGHAEINLEDYASGVYFVRVTGESGTATVRIVKE